MKLTQNIHRILCREMQIRELFLDISASVGHNRLDLFRANPSYAVRMVELTNRKSWLAELQQSHAFRLRER